MIITIQELIKTAMAAREKAYAPYSKFRVGAALLTEEGKVYHGCNVENASYGLTCCAERTAVFKAVSEGDTKFKAIALISDAEDFCTPCGACRQVLAEFGGNINVIMCNNRGEYREQKVSQLLPGYFTLTPDVGNTTVKG